MLINVHFYSYFAGLTGCSTTQVTLPSGSTIRVLISHLHQAYPKLVPMAKSTLIAVGVDYQLQDYILREGEEVSLFPPVQGG